LELEIPDENDEKIITAKINAKIKFIWSIYKYYEGLQAKSDRILQNSNAMLQKTNKLIDNLNEPLKFTEAMSDKFQQEVAQDSSGEPHVILKAKGGPKNHAGQNPNTSDVYNPQYAYADKIENFVKTSFSKN